MKSEYKVNKIRRISKMTLAPFLFLFPLMTNAEINIGEYVTSDATCTVSGTRLTVSGGAGEIIKQLPAEITELCVTNGASIKIGIDNPFAAAQSSMAIYLYGDASQSAGGATFATLDLNGHDIRISKLMNPWESDGSNVPHPGPGRVTNTSSSPATVSLALSMTQEFYGVFEESSGRLTLNVDASTSYNYMVFPSLTMDEQSKNPSSITFSGGAQMNIADNVSQLMFVFEPSEEKNYNGPISLAEIMPTFKGVPVKVKSIWVSSSSSLADLKDCEALIDGRADTGWRCGNDSNKRVVLFFDGDVPVDGYRIASWTATESRPKGWKVYKYSNIEMKWWLVDDQSGKSSSIWPMRGGANSFSKNVLFSAATRCGTFSGKTSSISLNNTARNTLAQISSTKTFEVGSLSGTATGTISIKNRSTFSAGDFTGYSGKFSAESGQGNILLSSGVNSEQPIRIPNVQKISIANGGTSPVSVLLNNGVSENFFGTMKDGENGTLGLVKRGAGERVIETEGASYTGATAIREGTLTVARRRTFTARYFRIKPLKTKAADTYGYPWSMNEFILIDGDGRDVTWPNGVSVSKPSGTRAEIGDAPIRNIADNDESSHMTMPNWETWTKETATTTDDFPAATIDAGVPLTFSAYRWVTCLRGWADDAQRVPLRWKISISQDGVNWTDVDTYEYAWSKADEDSVASGVYPASGVSRGPFRCGYDVSTAEENYIETLDNSFFASGSDRDTIRALSAQHFRIKVFETQRPDRDNYSYGWQVLEFSLWKNGERVVWPENPSMSFLGASVTGELKNLVDNVYTGDNSTRIFPQIVPSYVTFNVGEAVDFDAYSFTIFTDDYSVDRAPKSWILEISQDGENWTVVDSVGGWTMTPSLINQTASNRQMGPFNVASKYPYSYSSAANSIGDKSPVTIDSGATLKIAANYEKFGSLSGSGTLNISYGATAEINAFENAAFDGSVTGDNGSLAICGVATQTFSNVSIDGVKTLELNGGVMAGNVSFNGEDTEIVFNGGVLGASLSGLGTLNVSGEVFYAAPTDETLRSYVAIQALSISPQAQARLASGRVVGGDWSIKSVTDKQVILRNNKPWGLYIIVR